MVAESRKQITTLQEKQCRLHTNNLGRKVLDAQMAELARIGQRAGQYKYSPDQARVPAGSSDGGQWTSGGGGGGGSGDDGEDGDTSYQGEPDEPLDSVYPIEELIGGLGVGGALAAARRNALGARAALFGESTGATAESRVSNAARAIEEYLGGKPSSRLSRSGETTMISGNGKRIRFNTADSHGYEPHFHIEYEIEPNDWKDISKHMYFFNGK